jgi:hypothetical protein
MALQVGSILLTMKVLVTMDTDFWTTMKDVDPAFYERLASFHVWLWIEVAMFLFFLTGTVLFLLIRSQCKARRDRYPNDFQETTKDFLEYAFLSGLPESFVTFFVQTALFALLKFRCTFFKNKAFSECNVADFDPVFVFLKNKLKIDAPVVQNKSMSTIDLELILSCFQLLTITFLSFTGFYNFCFARKGRPICLVVFTYTAFLVTPLLFGSFFYLVMLQDMRQDGKFVLPSAMEAPTVLAFFIQIIAFPLKMLTLLHAACKTYEVGWVRVQFSKMPNENSEKWLAENQDSDLTKRIRRMYDDEKEAILKKKGNLRA